MERIRVKYLTEGIKIAEDVLNEQGVVVLPKGHILSKYDIEKLASNMGVEFVCVEDNIFLNMLKEEMQDTSEEFKKEVDEIFSVYNPHEGDTLSDFDLGIRLLALKFRKLLVQPEEEDT